jgi:hypothetical protein
VVENICCLFWARAGGGGGDGASKPERERERERERGGIRVVKRALPEFSRVAEQLRKLLY